MPFITHITGERTEGGRSVRERPHLLQSEAHHKELLTKAARVQVAQTYVWPRAILYQFVTHRRKRSRSSHRTRSHSQKDIRRELQYIPQTKYIPFGQEPPG